MAHEFDPNTEPAIWNFSLHLDAYDLDFGFNAYVKQDAFPIKLEFSL